MSNTLRDVINEALLKHHNAGDSDLCVECGAAWCTIKDDELSLHITDVVTDILKGALGGD